MSQAFPEWGAATNAPTMPAYVPPATPGGFAQSPFGANWDNPFVTTEGKEANVLQAGNNDVWIYRTIFGHDGANLIQQYQQDPLDKTEGGKRDNDADIHIYYEQDDKYNGFGSVCFVKIDRALARYISARSSKASPGWLAETISADHKLRHKKEAGYTPIDKHALEEAIAYELDRKSNELNPIANRILLWCGGELHSLAEWIRSLNYSEADWNPAHKQYKAGPIAAFIATLKQRTRSIDDTVQRAAQKIDSYKAWLPEGFVSTVNRLAGGIHNLCSFIDGVLELIERLGKAAALWNAFSCGFTNGLLDFIAGLVDMAGLILELTDRAEKQALLEGLENALQILRERRAEVWQQIKAAVTEFFEHYDGDKNSAYEIAYHAGEDIITVIGIVAIVRDALLALRKLVTKSGKLEKWVQSVLRKPQKFIQAEKGLEKSFFESAGLAVTRIETAGAVFGQSKGYTCVASSLRMVLEDRAIIYSEEYIARALGTTEDGVSLLDIPKALDNMYQDQIATLAKRNFSVEELTKALENGDNAIVSVVDNSRNFHAIVVDGIKGENVIVRDPLPQGAGSSYQISLSNFIERFRGRAVIIKK